MKNILAGYEPNIILKTSNLLPTNKILSNILRQYILSCLVGCPLLLYKSYQPHVFYRPYLHCNWSYHIGTATRFNVSTLVKVLAKAITVVCKQADWLTISSADKEKIYTKEVAGLDLKFSIIQTYDVRNSWSYAVFCLFNLFFYSSV